jgi:hypothetical protein
MEIEKVHSGLFRILMGLPCCAANGFEEIKLGKNRKCYEADVRSRLEIIEGRHCYKIWGNIFRNTSW